MMFDIPKEVTGLRLCKIVKGRLKVSEDVHFVMGRSGVDTVLRRAELAGKVGPIGEAGDYWADLLVGNGDWIETIALDKSSWSSLKNHWMRCRMVQ